MEKIDSGAKHIHDVECVATIAEAARSALGCDAVVLVAMRDGVVRCVVSCRPGDREVSLQIAAGCIAWSRSAAAGVTEVDLVERPGEPKDVS